MEYLPQQNHQCEGDQIDASIAIGAAGKRVVIIGAATPARTAWARTSPEALSVHQFEIMPKPPAQRAASTPWPLWPLQLRTEGAHEEGGIRDWSVNSIKFTGDENGNVKQLHLVRVGPPPKFEPFPAPNMYWMSISFCWPWASRPGALRHDRAVRPGR